MPSVRLLCTWYVCAEADNCLALSLPLLNDHDRTGKSVEFCMRVFDCLFLNLCVWVFDLELRRRGDLSTLCKLVDACLDGMDFVFKKKENGFDVENIFPWRCVYQSAITRVFALWKRRRTIEKTWGLVAKGLSSVFMKRNNWLLFRPGSGFLLPHLRKTKDSLPTPVYSSIVFVF